MLTSIAFVLAFLTGCALAFIRHPIFGLMTYVVILFVHPPDRWWGQGFLLNFRWSLIAAGVTIAAVLMKNVDRPPTPFWQQRIVWLILAFVMYATVQLLWAVDPERHWLLIEYYVKFLVAMWLIYRCIETEKHLVMFVWAYVLGALYLSWVAYNSHSGGRFDSFGGAGFGDANSGALTLVLATFMAGALLLVSKWRERWVLVGTIPFIVNGMIMTISRSAFLAATVGGLLFNFFTPRQFRSAVRILSIAAVVAFALLTNAAYWERIGTIAYKGEAVAGVDTGAGRLELMGAQLRMFRSNPLGCGHFCTDYLSASYLEERYLDDGARSSHNVFLSFLVDQGVVGAVFYVAMVYWAVTCLVALARRLVGSGGVLASLFPAIAACCGAQFVGDMFVPYVRFEQRFWLIALILVMLKLTASTGAARQDHVHPDMTSRQ